MNIKPSALTLPAIAIAALLMTSFHSIAMAESGMHCDHKHMSSGQMDPEKIHDQMKNKLDKLAERLEIKSSQQAAWGEFAKSVEAMAEQHAKKPKDDADAAAISRYQAERATEFAKKLTRIADSTGKLQKLLTGDQRNILNQASHHYLHSEHEGNRGWNRECHEHDQHDNADSESRHDDQQESAR